VRHDLEGNYFISQPEIHFSQSDSCQGDSGGPLQVIKNFHRRSISETFTEFSFMIFQVKGKDGHYFLAGIISWGIGCTKNFPASSFQLLTEFSFPISLQVLRQISPACALASLNFAPGF
jgi:Trypsin